MNRSKRSASSGVMELVAVTPSNPAYAGLHYNITPGFNMLEDFELRPQHYDMWYGNAYKPDVGGGTTAASQPYGQLTQYDRVGVMRWDANVDLVFNTWYRADFSAKCGFTLTFVERATGEVLGTAFYQTASAQFTAAQYGVAVHKVSGTQLTAFVTSPGTTTLIAYMFTVGVDYSITYSSSTTVVATVSGTANAVVGEDNASQYLLAGEHLVNMQTNAVLTPATSGMATGVVDGKYVVTLNDTQVKVLDLVTNAAQTITLGSGAGTGAKITKLWPGVFAVYQYATYAVSILKITYGGTHTATLTLAGNATWLPSNVGSFGLIAAVREHAKSDVFTFVFGVYANRLTAATMRFASCKVTSAGVASQFGRANQLLKVLQRGVINWLPFANWRGQEVSKKVVNMDDPILATFYFTRQSPGSNVSTSSLGARNNDVNCINTIKVVPAQIAGILKVAPFGTPTADLASGVPGQFLASMMGYRGVGAVGSVEGNSLIVASLKCVQLVSAGRPSKPLVPMVVLKTGTMDSSGVVINGSAPTVRFIGDASGYDNLGADAYTDVAKVGGGETQRIISRYCYGKPDVAVDHIGLFASHYHRQRSQSGGNSLDLRLYYIDITGLTYLNMLPNYDLNNSGGRGILQLELKMEVDGFGMWYLNCGTDSTAADFDSQSTGVHYGMKVANLPIRRT